MRAWGMREEIVDRRDDLSAFADRSADTLDRPRPDVADREHARHGGFERRRQGASIVRFGRPPVITKPALSSANSATVEPFCGRIRANEQKDIADRRFGLRVGATISPPDPFEAGSGRAGQGDDFGLRHQLDIRGRGDAIDQVARHAFSEARASDHHSNLGGVGGQKHRALAGGIAPSHENDLLAGAEARFDLRRPVPDPAALETRDIGDRRVAIPGAAGDNDRPGANSIAALEFDRKRPVCARAIERLHGGGNHHIRPKFFAPE